MTTCPACGNSVDPLRAPAVGIREGRIVSYCSRTCAASGESRPVVVAQRGALSAPGGMVATPGEIGADELIPPSPSPVGHFVTAHDDAALATGARVALSVPTSANPTGPAAAPAPMSAGPSSPDGRAVAPAPTSAEPSIPDGRAVAPAPTSTKPSSPAGRAKIANAVRVPDSQRAKARRPAPLLGISAAIAACALSGGAVAAYSLGYFNSIRRDAVRPDSVAVVTPVGNAATPDAAPQSSDAALSHARDLLRNSLRSDSTRISRIAASALARTGDPEAIALLAASVAKETSDLGKLDIYYALARGGNARGVEGLVAALGGSRRDVRLEAARRLALLGDKRAIDTLVQFLDVSQLRLGAAEQLAYLAEPRAIRVLEAVRADPKSAFADKARAAIALGHARKAEVAPMLRELLADARFNAFAAAALARLRDAASGTVRTLLVSQLGVASLRVGAARALRILDPGVDPSPLLSPLVARMTSGAGVDQVAAAEAVLMLAGPAAWSERE